MNIYEKHEDIPIGQLVQLENGKQYMVIKTPRNEDEDDCEVCAFYRKGQCSHIRCDGDSRKDGTHVIFIRYRNLKNHIS